MRGEIAMLSELEKRGGTLELFLSFRIGSPRVANRMPHGMFMVVNCVRHAIVISHSAAS